MSIVPHTVQQLYVSLQGRPGEKLGFTFGKALDKSLRGGPSGQGDVPFIMCSVDSRQKKARKKQAMPVVTV